MGKKSLFHWEKIKIGAHGLSTKNSTIKGFLVGKKSRIFWSCDLSFLSRGS